MVGVHERAQMGRKLEYVWIPRIDNSGEGVGYFNMGSYGTTLFNRPGSDAALPNLKKSRRVSIAGGDRKKGGFWFIYPSNTFPIKEMF